MTALQSLGVLLSLLVGVAIPAALSPLLIPQEKQGDPRLLRYRNTVIPLTGKIEAVEGTSVRLRLSVDAFHTDERIYIDTDEKTALLLRAIVADESGTLTGARLLRGPQEDIVKKDQLVRINARIGPEFKRPYAISVLTPPLQ